MTMQLVRVRPASTRAETAFVLAVLLGVAAAMGLRWWLLTLSPAPYYIRPFQRLDEVLGSRERLVYQSLLAAVPEVTALRSELGTWPEAAEMELEAIPPFAPQFLPRELRGIVWTSHNGGSWIDYHGGGDPTQEVRSFILRVIDLHADYHPHPHPGMDYDRNMSVATQVWISGRPVQDYPGERLPEAGWLWVVRPDDFTLRTRQEDLWTPTPVPTATPLPEAATFPPAEN